MKLVINDFTSRIWRAPEIQIKNQYEFISCPGWIFHCYLHRIELMKSATINNLNASDSRFQISGIINVNSMFKSYKAKEC